MGKTFFLILFLIYLFSVSKAQASQSNNISKGSTLYTNSTPNFWPSPSGHFLFGFYRNVNGFKVGIWIVGSPTNTIVWSTAEQRAAVFSSGASMSFSAEGSLLIRSSNGEVLQLIAKSGQRAAMLDSGNFVLYDSNSEIVWASFNDDPTDTLLAGQKLAQNVSLYSSTSVTNQSVGNFKLWMIGDGNLVALPLRSTDEGIYHYWSSSTSGAGKNITLNLDRDGHLYLGNSTGFIVKNFTGGEISVNNTTLYRATLDVDGIFRLYQHQIGTNGSLNYKILRKAISEDNRCLVKGICGLNSYCIVNGSHIACLCPPGFVYVDPKRPHVGCRLITDVENACLESTIRKNFTISTLESTFWQLDEYDIIKSAREEACSDACVEYCNCVVAQFRDQLCFKHKLPLRYGMKKITSSTKALIKVGTDGSPPHGNDQIINNISKKIGKEFVVVGVVLIAFFLIAFMFTGYVVYEHQIWSFKIISRQARSPGVVGEINLRSFSYQQLVSATDNFKEEIGRGGSGRVYKGSLAANNNCTKEIAVKKLIKMLEDGENEFRNEMKIIGRTHHKNLVNLVGFCSEGLQASCIRVHEEWATRNLLLKSTERPSWRERRKIALEIAKGLHYLHEECETRIIHCDIKPHNILMDESWTAKISDFGLSKLLKPDQTRTYTTARGTRGYTAPEWYNNNSPVTVKADAYSYGVMLLEIICCRKNVDVSLKDEEIVLMD